MLRSGVWLGLQGSQQRLLGREQGFHWRIEMFNSLALDVISCTRDQFVQRATGAFPITGAALVITHAGDLHLNGAVAVHHERRVIDVEGSLISNISGCVWRFWDCGSLDVVAQGVVAVANPAV